ncbi:MAG: leucine-rich repeat domain-containing protein [Spirochaetota bacterium]|jgi:hypothetical protein|nr:leucine-rich repeat domain-containing protein [Spirochaetota bacterium]
MDRKHFAGIAALLALVLPVLAQSMADFRVDLTKDNAGVVIIKYIGTGRNVLIPGDIQNLPVLELGQNSFRDNWSITNVVIPPGVTAIPRDAFRACSSLISVIIPEGIQSIGYAAFYRCTHLALIAFPDSLTNIGDYAFRDTALSTLVFPPDPKVFTEGYFGVGAFENCKNLRSVIIPEGVTHLPAALFYGCTGLTNVSLPSSIQSIGQACFQGCSALTSVAVPGTVTAISFSEDTKSQPASIDDAAKPQAYVGGAFTGCSRLPLANRAILNKLGYTGGFN